MSRMVLKRDYLPCFIIETECLSGVKKIAAKVREDLYKVFGDMPEKRKTAGGVMPVIDEISLVFGIVGQSPLIDDMAEKGIIDVSAVRGRREVYGFFPVRDDLLVIAGSDKRGAIYGLFHLSELLGVSPFVNWSALPPGKKDSFIIDDAHYFISREPSVEYRGFFINDEWPAFGEWCSRHFGGFTAEMYENVFELLLRLKGNYLWPAMWSSCFAEDGPGLASAELADELGVIMGLSHHEPCLRHGEEYSHVRGKDSIYGDAWSFISNKEGITRFWRDGLKRNGHLENVITVGMRGERDSTVLGKEATLADNINLLRDVLRTQEQLIKEEVNEDLSKVPRMLALYKEVEAYYYGDETTPGLKEGCPELEDVILMLCDDNHGYLRSLPDEQMRKHPGGFGMYYHFDYHGGPVSYEWINSTYLPEVWQQMNTAYEYGIQRLWIVNVGDLGLQELPLSYFLDMAYDFDKWGKCGPDSAKKYMDYWMRRQFGAAFEPADIIRLADVQMRASRLIHNRRPEHMNESVYHVQEDYEASRMLDQIVDISNEYDELAEKCPKEYKDALFELIGYSLMGGMNLISLWICRSFNHYYASIGALAANVYADMMEQMLKADESLKEVLHSIAGGKWDGFGEALHIGFKNWNSEECRNPVIETVVPVNGKALVAGLIGENGASRGMEWTKRVLELKRYDREDDEHAWADIFVSSCGREEVEFEIRSGADWLVPEYTKELLSEDDPFRIIELCVDKKAAKGESAKLEIIYPGGKIEFKVNAPAGSRIGDSFAECDGIVAIDAAHYSGRQDVSGARFCLVPGLGRREDAMALMPVTAYFDKAEDAPYLDYSFNIKEDGEYTVYFQLLSCNPWIRGRKVKLCFSVNSTEIVKCDAVSEKYVAGESYDWGMGVMNHVHLVEADVKLTAGSNNLRFYGTDPENVLERVIIVRKGCKAPGSFLGPDESFKE